MTAVTAAAPPRVAVAGTTPYPWPFDGDLDPARTALVVVVAADERLEHRAPERRGLEALATALRDAGGWVLACTTRPAPHRGGAGPAASGPRAPAWAPLVGEHLVDRAVAAPGVDAFSATDLELLITTAATRRLLLAGAPLEGCVHSTLRSANDRGLECLLLADACVPHDPALRGPALSMVEMSGGVLGAVGRTSAVTDALLRRPTPRRPPDPEEC